MAAVDGVNHDDVVKWKHFPRYWPFVWGIHRSPVNSPHKGQWRGALVFPLICTLINGWVNNRDAGDLRRHGAHYDVIVMHAVTLLLLKRKCCQIDAIDSMIIIPAMTTRVHVSCPTWKSHSNVFSCHISVPPNRQANIVTESYPRSPLKITLPKEARDNSGRTYFIPLRPRNKVRARVRDRHLYKITVYCHNMMTSSSGNIFRITGHVCGQFTGLFFDWRLN